jgi:phosphopantothenoylcysteine decarboxylase/phosphopantothenate--cysteine ligase
MRGGAALPDQYFSVFFQSLVQNYTSPSWFAMFHGRPAYFGGTSKRQAMRGKSILLIIGGGIAAYKSLELIRRLGERGVRSRVILTKAGAEFVTPLSVSALANEKVYSDLFSLTDEAEMGHIQLSRAADLVVVAPATADLMAKLAGGHANDLAATALLATDKPILMAPAMNVRMWESPSVRRNFETLTRDGVSFVGPNDGEMACGEFGPGRMAEPLEIVAAIEARLKSSGGALDGFRALVTAGPTQEPLDPVRFLANRSSGKQGYAIADALARAGAQTVLVSGPVGMAPPAGVKLLKVTTAREMLAACESVLPVDIAVMTAAVADWRPDISANSKIKKSTDRVVPLLKLVENPDILATLAGHAQRPRLLIGFAAETEDVIAHATAKRARKDADWIVANDVSGDVMGGDKNTVHLITGEASESWPEMTKAEVGARLAARIAQTLKGHAA